MKHTPSWLFFLLSTPGGVFAWGVRALLVPYLLRKNGVAVDRIAEVVAISSLPTMWSFVTAPAIDVGLRRSTWILLTSVILAISTFVIITHAAGSLVLLTALMFTGTLALNLKNCASGALMAALPANVRGTAAGWYQAGNIGAGPLVGGALIWLADHVSVWPLALVSTFLTFIAALAALRIEETPHPHLALRPLFTEMFHNIRDVIWSRRSLYGAVFILSPVGAGAIGNLISSVGPDYHAPGTVVALVTGTAGGAIMGLGCLIGGRLCDAMDRMYAYAAFGLLEAFSACWLWWGPATPFTYGAGYFTYSFTTGLAYAAYSALILDVIGKGQRGAAFSYSVYSSMGNASLIYMTWVDGIGYRSGGARGLMRTDALAGGVAACFLFALTPYFVKRLAATSKPAEMAAHA